jgi:uncharacterized protein (TIGR03437 family)
MSLRFFLAALLAVSLALGRTDPQICGTHSDGWKEQLFLHDQSPRVRAAKAARLAAPKWTRAARADAGNIAILEDADGVVSRRNAFNLRQRTITFTPLDATATRYSYAVSGESFDAEAASAGTPLSGLGDDDAALQGLPFAMPFQGQTYRDLWVNSDGNLTFGAADSTSTGRTLGRFNAGPPRIAALYADLDPSRRPGSVKVTAEASRMVVTWDGVPEYSDFGNGLRQTFQLRLYPGGRIDMTWSVVDISEAVVGIGPGELRGGSSVVSFATSSSGEFTGSVAERFTFEEEIDMVTAAQKFYANHEDSYDYLVVYNAIGVNALSSAVAYENTVRNDRTGYGDPAIDTGKSYGSPRRLQAVLNLGPLSQYPEDPNGFIRSRPTTRDTPLTVLAHEAGHLFLALASVRDPLDPNARPMLGFQNAHWAFTTNSEASLLEGNRIRDNGPGASPRFTTVGVTEGFSPLDQYLMGFRSKEEVPPTFYVKGPSNSFRFRQPQLDISFDGERVDVTADQMEQAEGRRTPDHTVAQRKFRFAFILVVAAGSEPSSTLLGQVDRYRSEFESFYARAANDRSTADTSLRRALQLSASPASGVLQGAAAPVSISIQQAQPSALTVLLRSESGNISVPASVTIPAGATSATFEMRGERTGVDTLIAEPSSDAYETVVARIQVSAASSALKLEVVSGDRQRPTTGQALAAPVVVRVSDINNLPYPGVPVTIGVTGGSVSPASGATDVEGKLSLAWTPSGGGTQTLTARIEGGPSITASTLPPRAAGNVVNAASFLPALAPGTLATLFGSGLTESAPATAAAVPWPSFLGGTRVLINGAVVPLLYVSSSQINFLVPESVPAGAARVVIESAGLSPIDVPNTTIAAAAPAIFFDAATGYGAILNAGTAQTTFDRPAARGSTVEIYATGLGATVPSGVLAATASTPVVAIGGVQAPVSFSGLAPGFVGLYQVNVLIPEGVPAGKQPLSISLGGATSNTVSIGIR